MIRSLFKGTLKFLSKNKRAIEAGAAIIGTGFLAVSTFFNSKGIKPNNVYTVKET